MKRTLLPLLAALSLLFILSAHAAAYVDGVDYMAQMMDAAVRGNDTAGREAQRCRDQMLQAEGLAAPQIAFDDLSLLARLIFCEAGSDWLDQSWKMAVGEVALNRVASPEFPDTLAAVIAQPGQYAPGVVSVLPNYASVLAAWRLLEGERVLNEPAVVFQSTVRQGGGVFLECYDSRYGSTYFCLSAHPELYHPATAAEPSGTVIYPTAPL